MLKLKYAGMVLALLAATIVFSDFKPKVKVMKYPFLKIGHRGTRGMMPENTIPSMTKAVAFGANVVELDVHITKDGQVVVYHDDSFDPNYTLMPDGSEIDPKNRNNYIFYQMNYADIKPFVIGTKKYKPYPQQQNIATYAPLLGELVDSVDHFTKVNKLPKVYYLVEIKADEKKDGINQPGPAEFVKKVMDALAPKKLGDRLIIQSFDKRQLREMHANYPKVATGFLIGDAKLSVDQHVADLGFTPTFYNPHYSVVTDEFIKQCHDKHMLVCPWTVNDVKEMQRVLDLKVDGIITDYPNYLPQVLK